VNGSPQHALNPAGHQKIRRRFARRRLQTEVLVGVLAGHAAASRAQQETLLDQEWLQHILDGAALLADGCRQAVHPHRSAVEFLDDRQQQAAIKLIEAMHVHFQQIHGLARHRRGNTAIGLHLGEVPYTPQQPVGDAGVPRERVAISRAPSASQDSARICAERITMRVSSS